MDDIAALLRQDFQKPLRPPRGPRPGHAVFRQGFVPALLLGSSVVWTQHVVLERRLRGAGVGIDALTLVLLASLLVVWVAEQLYPAHSEWNYNLEEDSIRGLQRFGRDMVYLVVMTQATALLIGFTSRWLSSGSATFGSPTGRWPTSAPFAIRVALVFLITELASYWIHRAAHRLPLLWRFHRTHHVTEELGGLKSMRLHPVDNLVFYVARTVPLLFLGVGPDEILTVTYMACTLSILSHANVSVAESRLGWVVNLPQYHQVHHSADVEESNSNFGCHTVLWDRLFGTFRREAKGTLLLGVEPRGPRTLWQELGWAFYHRLEAPPRSSP